MVWADASWSDGPLPCIHTVEIRRSQVGPELLKPARVREAALDAAFLLTVGSFLLTLELFCLQLTILAFLLRVGAFSLTVLAFAYPQSGKKNLHFKFAQNKV